MEVTGDPSFVRSSTSAVPVIGKVHPDVPLISEENTEDYVALPEVLLGKGKHFILRVQDARMKEDGIIYGDYAVVHVQEKIDDGDLVVVLHHDELILGRCRRAADATVSVCFSDGTSAAIYPAPGCIVGEVVSLFRMIK